MDLEILLDEKKHLTFEESNNNQTKSRIHSHPGFCGWNFCHWRTSVPKGASCSSPLKFLVSNLYTKQTDPEQIQVSR